MYLSSLFKKSFWLLSVNCFTRQIFNDRRSEACLVENGVTLTLVNALSTQIMWKLCRVYSFNEQLIETNFSPQKRGVVHYSKCGENLGSSIIRSCSLFNYIRYLPITRGRIVGFILFSWEILSDKVICLWLWLDSKFWLEISWIIILIY